MDLKSYLEDIEKWSKDYLESLHLNTYVLGLSGGVDSSLVAAIIKKAVGKERLMCLIIPIESNENDAKDAIEVAETLGVNYLVLNADNSYHQMINDYQKIGITLSRPTLSNLKVRIRMSMLYAYAQENKGLVVGTDNMDERYTGYFTKYGDGACDILPIVHLTKSEVVDAALLYGVPERLAKRTPSAGLFPGQTDEKEMGVLYKDLDNYLLGKEVDKGVEERILYLHKISEHKRNEIPSPHKFERD